MIIITLNDVCANSWSPPVAVQNDRCAIRDFDTACKNSDSLIGQHPEDFILYAIGEWTPSMEECSFPVFKAFDKPILLKKGSPHVSE